MKVNRKPASQHPAHGKTKLTPIPTLPKRPKRRRLLRPF